MLRATDDRSSVSVPTPVIVLLALVGVVVLVALGVAGATVVRSLTHTTGALTELAGRLEILEERTGELHARLRRIDDDLGEVADELGHDRPAADAAPDASPRQRTPRGQTSAQGVSADHG